MRIGAIQNGVNFKGLTLARTPENRTIIDAIIKSENKESEYKILKKIDESSGKRHFRITSELKNKDYEVYLMDDDTNSIVGRYTFSKKGNMSKKVSSALEELRSDFEWYMKQDNLEQNFRNNTKPKTLKIFDEFV